MSQAADGFCTADGSFAADISNPADGSHDSSQETEELKDLMKTGATSLLIVLVRQSASIGTGTDDLHQIRRCYRAGLP